MGIIWKIERRIRRTLIAHSRDPRPGSAPFISGDGFRALADHIYEDGRENPDGKSRSFDPAAVAGGDIVFVQSDLLDRYFSEIHPRIRDPYKLITHNGDRNITEADLRLIDSKIIRWFAQNALAEHPKLTPIPIGLENRHYANAGLLRFFKKRSLPSNLANDKNVARADGGDDAKPARNGRILVNFNAATNPAERIPCKEAMSKNPLADTSRWKSQPGFAADMRRYSAVVSPPGNGADCHRTWEALCLGAVPIVKDSTFAHYFKSLGIPLCIVADWHDIPERFVYDDSDRIYFDYWKKIICSSASR